MEYRYVDVTIYREVIESKKVRVRLPTDPEFTEESLIEAVWNQEPVGEGECWRPMNRKPLQRNEIEAYQHSVAKPPYLLTVLDGNLVPKANAEHINSAKAVLNKSGYKIEIPLRTLKVKPTPVVEEEGEFPEGFDKEETYHAVERAFRGVGLDISVIDEQLDGNCQEAINEYLVRVFQGEDPVQLAYEYEFLDEE